MQNRTWKDVSGHSKYINKKWTHLMLRCVCAGHLECRKLYKCPSQEGKPVSFTSSWEGDRHLKKDPKTTYPHTDINWESSKMNKQYFYMWKTSFFISLYIHNVLHAYRHISQSKYQFNYPEMHYKYCNITLNTGCVFIMNLKPAIANKIS